MFGFVSGGRGGAGVVLLFADFVGGSRLGRIIELALFQYRGSHCDMY